MFDEGGQEAYSGEWTATRKEKFELVGDWKATAEVNGDSNESTVSIEAKGDGYTGKIIGESGSIDITSTTMDDKGVTIKFPYNEVEVVVKATPKDGKLVGKWSVTMDDGTDVSGAWAAEKKAK